MSVSKKKERSPGAGTAERLAPGEPLHPGFEAADGGQVKPAKPVLPAKTRPVGPRATVAPKELDGGDPGQISGLDAAMLSVELMRRHALWVYEHLDDSRMVRRRSPSSGAWSLLQWARGNRTAFFKEYLPKAVKEIKDDEQEKFEAAERKSVAEIRAIIKQYEGAASSAAAASV